MSLTPHPSQLRGKDVLILGLGAFGGGVGCAKALCRLGARVTVTDLRDSNQLQTSMEALRDFPIEWSLGGHPEELFQGQLVVVNPAVPLYAPVMDLVRAQGCPWTTEINLALALRPDLRMCALTGTHGKSTTASLTAHLLREHGLPTLLAGNLGGSLFEKVQQLEPTESPFVVLELSSFQTEALDAPPGWPEISALTCLGEDHLDRHQTVQHYWEAKKRMLEFQRQDGICLYPAHGKGIPDWVQACRGQPTALGLTSDFAEQWRADAPFQEDYRFHSVLVAAWVARHWGVPDNVLHKGLGTWECLPHRMMLLPESPPEHPIWDNGVATHPDATLAALKAFDIPPVLLAGGADKGIGLDELRESLTDLCHAVHLSGPGGKALAEQGAGIVHADMASATRAAFADLAQAPNGTPLLFSPSFSSFDEFSNFQARALQFREILKNSEFFKKMGT